MKPESESINGLHLVRRGVGAHTLVFLHYFGGSAHAWDGVITRLEAGFHCIAVDMRGFGHSAAPEGVFRVDDYTEDLLHVLAAVQPGSYTLAGHSMCGKFALSIAARQPAGLQSLVLIAPSPLSPEPMTAEDRSSLMDAFRNREALRQKLDSITGKPLPSYLLEGAVEDNMRTAPTAWESWLQYGSREDITASAGSVQVPVSILTGAKDKRFTTALMEQEIKTCLPQTRITELPEAGHLIPLEAPDGVAELIRGSLNGT